MAQHTNVDRIASLQEHIARENVCVGPAYSNQISFHRAAYSWNFMFNQCDHFLECHADAPTFRVKTMQNKSIKKQKSESFCDIRMCFVCDVL